MKQILSSMVLSTLFVLPVAAHAADDDAETPDAPAKAAEEQQPKEDRHAYVSFSPLHLLFPIVEVTGEIRLHRNIGLAVIGGYGTMGMDTNGEVMIVGSNKPELARFTVWEVGGQFVGYPVGHFDNGMQVGMEALYVGVQQDANRVGGVQTAGVADGFAVGPFVGYKLATRVGFTFNVQGGVEMVVARADSSAGGATAHASTQTVIPLLNANVGWSF